MFDGLRLSTQMTARSKTAMQVGIKCQKDRYLRETRVEVRSKYS